jgi:hypothetical protein
MTDYPFGMQLVVDPLNPDHVVAEGQVYIYDPSDTGFASPLALKDLNGLPLPNPLISSPAGFLEEFVATSPQVLWKSGDWTGLFDSYRGMLDEVIAIRAQLLAALTERGVPTGGTTGQVLAKAGEADFATVWQSPIVIIGPLDAWPTGLPEGTIVVRTEA